MMSGAGKLSAETRKLDVQVSEVDIHTSKRVRSAVSPLALTMATYGTYIVSALWHGFYSGYYLTFVTGAYQVVVERHCKKYLFAYFTPNADFNAWHWRLAGWVYAQLMLAYCSLPFITLYWLPSVRVWMSVWAFGHVWLLAAHAVSKYAKIRMHTKPRKQSSSTDSAGAVLLNTVEGVKSVVAGID